VQQVQRRAGFLPPAAVLVLRRQGFQLRQALGRDARRLPPLRTDVAEPIEHADGGVPVPFLLTGIDGVARPPRDQPRRLARHAAVVAARQRDLEQVVLRILAEPAPQAPQVQEPARSGSRLEHVLAGRPGEDLLGEELAQEAGALLVQPVVGADDPRREGLEALAHPVRHVVVDRHREGLDQR
jgi:hypothetical protein